MIESCDTLREAERRSQDERNADKEDGGEKKQLQRSRESQLDGGS